MIQMIITEDHLLTASLQFQNHVKPGKKRLLLIHSVKLMTGKKWIPLEAIHSMEFQINRGTIRIFHPTIWKEIGVPVG